MRTWRPDASQIGTNFDDRTGRRQQGCKLWLAKQVPEQLLVQRIAARRQELRLRLTIDHGQRPRKLGQRAAIDEMDGQGQGDADRHRHNRQQQDRSLGHHLPPQVLERNAVAHADAAVAAFASGKPWLLEDFHVMDGLASMWAGLKLTARRADLAPAPDADRRSMPPAPNG